MSGSFPVPSSRIALVDSGGRPTREFYLFLTNLFNVTGQGSPLGTAAFKNTGSSGGTVPLLNATNTWSGQQTFTDGDMTLSGTGGGATTLHSVATVNRDITFPDSTDTAVLVAATQSLTNKTILSASNTLDVKQVAGSATNDSASAGNLGEYISSTVLIGSAVTLTTATPTDITSISLTAGDWDVWGSTAFNSNAATVISNLIGWINTTSATQPTIPNGGSITIFNLQFQTATNHVFPIGTMRVSVGGTTTVYLSCNTVFTTNTLAAYGFLGARRRR